MGALWFGWVVLGGAVPVSLLTAAGFVRSVHDWLEPTGFAHVMAVMGLALAIFGTLLVPVDLYNVASLSDSLTGVPAEHDARREIFEHAAVIVVLYQAVYLSLCGFLFILLPFAYFWSEFAVQQPDGTPTAATLHAAGFASIFAVIAGLIGVLGMAVQPVPPPPALESEAWAMQLLQDDSGPLGPAMDAVLGAALLLGTLVLGSYGAVGLATLPEALSAAPRADGPQQLSQVRDAIQATREALRVFESTFGLTGRRMSRAQRRQQQLFKQREEVLQRREVRLEQAAETSARTLCTGESCAECRGLRRAGALLLLGVLALLLYALLVSVGEMAGRSLCGHACGYLLLRHYAANPIDAILLAASAVFPLDAAVVGALLLLLPLGAVLAASHRTGVRFLCFRLWPLRARGSSAPAVTLAVLHLMLGTLAFSAQLYFLAPQYAAFGSQAYVDAQGAVRPCSLECATSHSDGPDASPCAGKCALSALATTLLTLMLRLPLFGAAWYYAQWLFLAACAVSLIAMASRRAERGSGPTFTPMVAGGVVDGIDDADPEALDRGMGMVGPPQRLATATERTPVLGGGGGGGASNSNGGAAREARRQNGAKRQPSGSNGGSGGGSPNQPQQQWWAQGPARPG